MPEVWRASGALLSALRDGPQPIDPPLSDGATLVLDLALTSAAGRRVVVHRGDLRAQGDGDAFALSLRDGRIWLHRRRAGVERAWRSGRLRRGWRRVHLILGDGPAGASVDGVALTSTPSPFPDDVHGDVPVVPTLVLGGLRDRAGGHTNLRYGERPGEAIVHASLHVGEPPSAAVGATPGIRVVTRERGGVVHAHALGVPDGATLWWDLGDRIVTGDQVAWPRSFARREVTIAAASAEGAAPVRPPRQRGARSITVFAPGEAGYAAFRIPAIVRATDGALLAFAEARRESVSDSCRTKHLVVRPSRDEGRTWGPITVCAALPDGPGVRSLMNPSPVVDVVHGTGRIVLVHNAMSADEWSIAAGSGRARLRAVASDDHGRTWSDAVDIAADWGLPDGLAAAWPEPTGWRGQVGTLGHAVQLRHGPHPGRLMCTGHGTFGPGSVFDAVAYLFHSDDLGATWTLGPAFALRDDGTPARGPNETTLAELPDGTLHVNARHYRDGRPVGYRAVANVTWDAHGRPVTGPIRTSDTLIDSGVQASLLALDPDAAHPHGRLLFCNPAHPTARLALTLRESRDGGVTWPIARLLVAGRTAYSDLVALTGGVGVLFEMGADGAIAFLAVPLGGP